MPRSQPNSMIQRGQNRVRTEEGRVINVDMAHWTADVKTTHSQRNLIDLQWSCPYVHFAAGEGINFMPEVGAKCHVTMPSDSSPYISDFYVPFERESSQEEDEPGASTMSDVPQGEENPQEVSFRAGRAKLQQGDIRLSTRDGNHIWLHRGGVVEVGSKQTCQRFYIPLLNTIRDVCERYQLHSVGGEMMWTVNRSDVNADGEIEVAFTLAARRYAQDPSASVYLKAGYVDETNRFRLVVAPNSIDPTTGEVTGDTKFEWTVDKDGNVDVSVKKDVTISIEGGLDMTVTQSASCSYQGGLTEEITGEHVEQVRGNHSLEATASREEIAGQKEIAAAMIKLGAGARFPVVLANPAFLSFLFGHVHPVAGSTTGVPAGALNPSMIAARKVIGE